jgi:hypothetical protein
VPRPHERGPRPASSPAPCELRVGISGTVSYSYPMSDPRPRDDRDVAKDIARDLAEIAAHIGQLKGDANAYLTNPNYNTLRLRLEIAHSAVEAATVEARRRVRLNEGRERQQEEPS